MADINQVITLGIGTPSGIPEFLTFGLQIAGVRPTPSCRKMTILAEDRTITIESEDREYAISC